MGLLANLIVLSLTIFQICHVLKNQRLEKEETISVP